MPAHGAEADWYCEHEPQPRSSGALTETDRSWQ